MNSSNHPVRQSTFSAFKSVRNLELGDASYSVLLFLCWVACGSVLLVCTICFECTQSILIECILWLSIMSKSSGCFRCFYWFVSWRPHSDVLPLHSAQCLFKLLVLWGLQRWDMLELNSWLFKKLENLPGEVQHKWNICWFTCNFKYWNYCCLYFKL